MARPKMPSLTPGQIPEWRPGAIFWKPLVDGREVTVYPLLAGTARLCVGPLASKEGYDVAYLYDTNSAAVDAATMWDGENMERPPGYVRIEFQQNQHATKSPVHSQGVQAGQRMELTDRIKEHFEIIASREKPGVEQFNLMGLSEDGYLLKIDAVRHVGDPVGNEGQPMITITSVITERQPG